MGWRQHYEARAHAQRDIAIHMGEKPSVDWRPGSRRWPVFDKSHCGEIISNNSAAGLHLDDPEKL